MKSILFRILKVVAFVAIALITLVALVIAEENFRGQRAWTRCQAELAARGETLDWTQLATPAGPDEQNFYKTPLLAPLSDMVRSTNGHWEARDTNAVEHIKLLFNSLSTVPSLSTPGWRLGEAADLAAAQAALRTETNTTDPDLRRLLARPAGAPHDDLLILLETRSAELAELHAALQRPNARFGGHLEEGMNAVLPHLAPVRSFGRALETRALARLAAGNVDGAADDLVDIFRLARTLESEPLLITTLIEVAVFGAGIQPLWDGLARHQWQERHLAAFREELNHLDFVAAMVRSLRFERASSIQTMELWRNQPQQIADAMASSESLANAVPVRMPGGWVRLSQVQIARMFQDFLVPVFDTNRGVVDVALGQRLSDEALKALQGVSPYRTLARMLFPALGAAIQRGASAQTTLIQARLAVALERARLTQGAYPQKLEALVPLQLTTLPGDPVNGEPLQYRRTAPDRFVLYSIGLNLRDDGGAVAVTKKGVAAPREAEGDWVWQNYPVTNRVTVVPKPK